MTELSNLQIISKIIARTASVALILMVAVPIVLICGAFISNDVNQKEQYVKIKKEISRVQSASGVTATATYCRDVEFAPICYVEYNNMDYKTAKKIFIDSGYTVEKTTKYDEPLTGEKISASNESTKIRVDGETSDSKKDVTTIKFKDIKVTL